MKKTMVLWTLTLGIAWAQITPPPSGGGGSYTLPAATNSTLGGVTMSTATSSVARAIDDGAFAIAIGTNAEYSNGTCTTSKTIAPANGNRQKVTLTNAQTCALTFTQPVTGTVSIQLKVIQSSAGSFNGAISGGLWPGGTAPTITATSGAVDILSCYLDGSTTYCVATQDFR